MESTIPILILNGRPAAGKSEVIHALRKIPLSERISEFHIGSIHVLDDFPMLWAWFEEDDLLKETFNLPRLHTDGEGYFLRSEYWHLLIHRLSLDYKKFSRDQKEEHTVIIEFSRGEGHGGYQAAFQHLSDEILHQSACMYVQVSYEESLRKNRARFNPDRLDSILEHGLPDEKMGRLYREDDWLKFTADNPDYFTVREIKIPYVTFDNEEDVTTSGGEPLFRQLKDSLDSLWDLAAARPAI